ncbi:MAG TPA: DUF885 family protein, partial [Opitutus sp.]|nr:DUF885 family protein [Opitutus sp.]
MSLARAAEPSFDAWADEFSKEWVRLSPQTATRTQYFPAEQQDAIDRKMAMSGAYGGFYGAKAAEAAATVARQGLEELNRFASGALTPTQRTSAAVIKWTLEDAISGAEFAQHSFVFEQIGGFHLGLVEFLTTTHPIRNVRDIENYLARLSLVAPLIDEGIAETKAAAAAGIIAPSFILQRVIEQIDGFVATPPKDNVLVSTLDARIEELGAAVLPAARTAFVTAAEKEVRASVLPAYQRIGDALTGLLPRANEDAGIWRLPRGGEAYQRALASNTTTSLTAGEIQAMGLREVARIEAEMEKIFQELGYTKGSIQERTEQLNASLQLPAEPDPRPILLERVKQVVADSERRAEAAFDLRPKAPVTVIREPAFSET